SGALEQVRRSGEALLAGPFDVGEGVRGVAYAILPTFGENVRKDVRHVVRIEADVVEWRQSVLLGGVLAGLGVCGLFGIPLAMLLLGDRQRIQSNVIRNLSEAVEQAHSAILILDPGGRIEFCNEVGSRRLGISRRNLIGRNLRDFLKPAGPAAGEAEIDGNLAAGVAWQGELNCLRADGTSFPVRGGFSPVRRRDQQVVSFVAVFDDMTELRSRENELREAKEQARAGDRAKGNFLATMSHEVRTPLNAIVGFTGLLLESSPLSEVQRDQLLAIRASAEALVRLTSDILDFARIESGTARIDLAPCDPRECVEEAIDLHAAAAAQKGLEIFHRISPGVPASLVTDHGRLRQILLNLVGNAVKFTERGEIEVSASVADADGDERGLRVEFVVRDTGLGIVEEDQGRLFRPFTQLEATNLRRHGGAGLGLALSRDLVGMLGGEIRFESRLGRGSTFRFSIRARVERPPRFPDAAGAKVGVVAPAGRFRDSLMELVRSWKAEAAEADTIESLPPSVRTVVLRDLDEAGARDLASSREPARAAVDGLTVALVPVSLEAETQAALRARFQAVLVKPVRSGALFPLVAGAAPEQPAAAARPQFGFRVLVAEDNLVNQRLIRLMLENFGCVATVVSDGRAAIAALVAAPLVHDLVLLDMHMPELDGIEVLQAIRSGGAGAGARGVWVVALSADVRAEQRAAAAAAGVDEYMTKPVSLRGVEEMLLRLRTARRLDSAPVG
ncbi:MAG: ATP-binding protein, partial [Opitutaceae bacterium]